MRTLYIDCFSGLAGDMTLGALIDLGLDPAALEAALRTLPLPDWTMQTRRARRHGLEGVDLHFLIGGRAEGPHGENDEGPLHHYADIVAALRGGRLPSPVVARAVAVFDALAEAEAQVHGVPREAVHFHEVGAVDSVLDIAGVCFGLWSLGIERLISAPPPLGRGLIRGAHGPMPLPAPATLALLQGLPITGCAVDKELVTPTGAAFLKVLVDEIGPIPSMILERVGVGVGDLELPDRPNLLRLLLGRLDPRAPDAFVVEANLDDLNPEIAGYLLERLFEAGALDAWFTPAQMKKGRPGVMIGALVDEAQRAAVEATLLAESSTLGLRRYGVSRHVRPRRHLTVETAYGPVRLKLGGAPGEVLNVAPEYEDCAALARAHGVPLKEIYRQAIAAHQALT